MTGWRVGECPEDLRQAKCQMIPLENCEEQAPGQVSASYKILQSSAISLAASSNFGIEGSVITLCGQLSPKLSGKSITIYFNAGGSLWSSLAIVKTDSDGKFSLTWTAKNTGVYQFRASWSGEDEYAGADSPTVTITVISMSLLILFLVAMASVCVGVFFLVLSRKVEEPELPEAG
ncbi:MAG: Ig-like domain-containing protein [Candidatus Bathyarchaeia archaeon]